VEHAVTRRGGPSLALAAGLAPGHVAESDTVTPVSGEVYVDRPAPDAPAEHP
jgi:hypothetical protein